MPSLSPPAVRARFRFALIPLAGFALCKLFVPRPYSCKHDMADSLTSYALLIAFVDIITLRNIICPYRHNISMKKNFILCGLTGWCMEVLWTGIGSVMARDPKLTCRTSMLMFPIYGMASLLTPLCRQLSGKNIFLRGGVYTICIFAAEYAAGAVLKKHHRCPWDYSKKPANINGLITFSYTPLWFCAGLFFEKLLMPKLHD